GLGWFSHPQAILHFAELGVVMFLFVVGLEMRPSQLWNLRRQIFGLGALQIGFAGAALTGVLWLLGLAPQAAFIGGAGFVMTSTAIVMQVLGERGDIALPRGQRMVSILLFEDLLIVPLLALVAVMSHAPADPDAPPGLVAVGIAAAALLGLVVAGLYLLNPLFRLLAAAKGRGAMTAAALLVVRGAAAPGDGWGGPVPAAVPVAGGGQGAGGHDGGGMAGGAGCGAAGGDGRAVDGHGRRPGRGAAVRGQVPAPDRGRRGTVPRHPLR